RECLVADPDRVLVAYDYSGIEYVTLAAITRDPGMLAVVRAGLDPHLEAAEVIWPGTRALADEAERKQRRTPGQAVHPRPGLRHGADTLAARSGLTLPEVRRARDRLRRAWPGAHRAMSEAGRAYWRGDQELTSPFGRRYRVPTREGAPSSTRP
ncbi:MAG: hypothetical protein M3Q22_07075, partial [Actinomycetota bacterium]|nr:hypothetical protein [Actinomycetota bacterium]